MKTFMVHDGPRTDADPSLEQIGLRVEPLQDVTDGDASQGSEFLDDALRMHEQDLGSAGADERG